VDLFWVLYWVTFVVFAVMLAVLLSVEREALAEDRARRRALMLDAGRLTAALLMFLALPLAEPRPLAPIGLGLAVFAFVAVPTSWALSAGGIDPIWQIRRLQGEGAELMTRYGSPMPPEGAEKMQLVIAELERAWSPETAELCVLLSARYRDWIAGEFRPLDLGRRVIRIYDLQRRHFGDEVKPPELSEEEATFRWRLYRVFAEMVDCAGAQQTARQRDRLARLMRELDAYRRDDTMAFIDGLRLAATVWQEAPGPRQPWRPPAAIRRGSAQGKQAAPLWPRTSVFWGAILDGMDRAELEKVTRGGVEA
jgi:hypothetical protein